MSAQIQREPHIVINGIELTEGQAMTLRVALSSWLQFHLPEIADDLGQIGRNYTARGGEVLEYMLAPRRPR